MITKVTHNLLTVLAWCLFWVLLAIDVAGLIQAVLRVIR